MSREQVTEEIVDEFERLREVPGSSFDRDRLVDYLVANPTGNQHIESTYKGRRLFSRFIEKLELRLAVCFSLKDLETLRGLDSLADRISHLQKSPRGSIGVITGRLKEPFPLNLAIVISVLCLLPVGLSIKLAGAWGMLSLLIPGGLLFTIWRLHEVDRKHCREVLARIKAKEQITPNTGAIGRSDLV